MCAIVGEHNLDFVWNSAGKRSKKVSCNAAGRLLMQLDEGELGRSVDGHEQIEFAFLCSDFGDIDVEVADRISV